MKCIYCNADTNHSARKANGGCCENCGHRFVFEPQQDKPAITDRFFLHAYDRVSGGGTVACTERQLWYELNRMLGRAWARYSWIALVVGVFAFWLVGLLFGGPSWAKAVVAGIVGIAAAMLAYRVDDYRRRPKHTIRLGYEQFIRGRYVENWANIHSPLEKVLVLPKPDAPIPARDVEPDLTHYSFDRALVTDKAETAALLVANNFHFEYNCAILSADGYPPGTAGTVMAMLRRNPKLQVFALHDATVEGCRLPLLLRTWPWFPEANVTVLDLGLRPRHALARRMIILHGPSTMVADELATLLLPSMNARRSVPSTEVADELATLLTPSEMAWLERGNRAEIAEIRPERLLRMLAYGIAQAAQLREDAWATGEKEAAGSDEADNAPDPRGWSWAGVFTGLAVMLHLRDDPGRLEETPRSIWIEDGREALYSIDSFG